VRPTKAFAADRLILIPMGLAGVGGGRRSRRAEPWRRGGGECRRRRDSATGTTTGTSARWHAS